MQSILETITNSNLFTSHELVAIYDQVQKKTVKKGTILQMQGDIADKIFFVKKGLLRSYIMDENGKEHIFMFAAEDWIIADTVSQIFNTPTDLFIDAIEDSEIEVCHKDFFEKVILQRPEFGLSGTEKLTKRLAVLQKRVLMLMGSSAWDRYQNFLETYPNIVQRVPQKMIASYLGITPEALSKIRGDMLKKK